jgi:outer membrane receptor protein involved in Fe transport
MKRRGIIALLLAMSLPLGYAFGQAGVTGSILGRVSDSADAAIPGATVTIVDTATGAKHVIKTNESGEYTVPELPTGPYSVKVEAPGFGIRTTNLTITVAQQARVDAHLAPGTAETVINVDASAVSLDTDSSSVSQLVSQKQVDSLPLNGRNFLNLLFIGAGAVETVGEQGQMRQGQGNAISINGGRPESNNYTLDGMSNTDTALNTPSVILSQDAIQEFKVQSETYSAEFGFSANQVNIVSKSGTNQLHGTGFEFLRNDAFDASTHFQGKTKLRQNQFGFVLGGPVFIPKLYDGRNKTFFLANYEGWRIILGTSASNVFVPTPTQLLGNFGGFGLPAYGTAACTAVITVGACQPIDPNTGQPFPNNTIPTSRFSKIANVTLAAKLIPAPNRGANGFFPTTSLPNSTNQQTYRVDQTLGKFGNVFGRYTKASYITNQLGTTSIPFGLTLFTENSSSWEISHTISLGSRNVNNIRYGQLSSKLIQGVHPAPQADITALGLSGVFTSLPDYARGYPTISIGGYSGNFGSPGNDPVTSDIPQWEIADSFTASRGKHTLSFGFDYRSWVQKRNLSSNFVGSYGYASNTITQNSNGCTTASGLCGTGNSVADFLLGYYSGASTFQPGPFSTAGTPGNENQFHFKYFGPYFQDDWKISSKLTLNVGLRWDYRSVPFETHDKMFWIDSANAKGGLCFANQALLTDGVAPAGNGLYRYCGRNNPADGSKTSFAPRLGFAWRPFNNNKTVIRGGYGIFFDSSETREIDNSGDLYPYVVRTNLNPISQSVPKLTDNLFPSVAALAPVSVAATGGQFVAVIISENPINPYVQQFSFSVQRELARNTTIEINYVGNKASHLLDRTNINQPIAVASPAVCDLNANAADCPVAGRRPLTNFTSFATLDSRWTGYSNYNAGNIKLEKRSSDIAAVLVYTWSKSMDDKSAPAGIGATNGFAGHLNDRNPSLDYARSDFDVGQRFVASYVYNLPIGKGKKLLSTASRGVDAAVGGWSITGIGTFQKGFPFSVLASDKSGLLNTFTQRANLSGNPNGSKSVTKYFNTAAFSQPLAGQFGNSGRNILRQPGINNFDMGLMKNLELYERLNLQFRLETFNTFNHVQYGVDPNASNVGPGSAAVDTNVNDQTILGSSSNAFGSITSARPGRILQLGAKVTF